MTADGTPERGPRPNETAAEIDARDELPSSDATVEELFHEALAVPGEERRAWLERRTRDAILREEVASLLAAHDGGRGFLERPPAGAMGLADAAAVAARGEGDAREVERSAAEALLGQRVGEFTLQAVLGQGGMGVVYRAEQRQPQRTVALKLVRPGYTSAAMVRRLELEAEVLGRLRHPGIASVYAAGTADLGFGPQPYVAMELVEGWPLRDWLAASDPTVEARVRALIDIAEAVQHAHQNGIIHRDLKPENLLIEEQPGSPPRPRVLDFGVARLTREDLAARAHATEDGHLVGTLQYMSPEQVRGEPVDTRCDVFALGLIAWEMLVGRPARTIGRGSLAGAVKAVIEQTPPPPHTILRSLPLDLSMVVAKALEPEAARRYASAHEFAVDLLRFLRKEPVTARAPTTVYLLRQYAARHRARVAAAGAVTAIALAAFVAVTALLLRTRAAEERERQRADDSTAVVDYILWTLGVDAQVQSSSQVDVTRLRTLLADLGRDVDGRLASRPQAQARLLNAIGERYHTLNDYPLAKATFERSLAICDALPDRRTALRGAALHGLAAAEFFLAQGDRTRLGHSRELYEEALATRIGALGRDHSDTALTMRHLAAVLRSVGEGDRAESLYRESLAIHERLHAAGDPLASPVMVASGYNGLATYLAGKGEHEEASSLFAASLALMRNMPHGERRAVDEARVLRNLGVEQGATRRFADGAASLAEAESIFRQQLGPSNREVAITILRRGQIELARGDATAAAAAARSVMGDFGLAEGDVTRADAAKLLEAALRPGS